MNRFQSTFTRAMAILLTALSLGIANPAYSTIQNVNATIAEGIRLANMDDYEAALAKFEQAIEQAPNNSIAYAVQTYMLRKLNRLEEAKASQRKAMELAQAHRSVNPNYAYPANVMSWMAVQEGLELARQDNIEDAQSMLSQAIALNPDNINAYTHREMLSEARSLVEQGLASGIDSDYYRYMLAKIVVKEGQVAASANDFKGALAKYDRAIELAPDYIWSYQNRADILKNLKQFKAATQAHTRALKMAKNAVKKGDKPMHYRAYLAYMLNTEGIDLFNKSDVKSKRKKSNALKKALAKFDEAIRLDPNSAHYHLSRFQTLRELAETKKKKSRPELLEKALPSLKRAIELAPHNKQAVETLRWVNLNIGDVLYEADRYKEALAQYNEAIRFLPTEPVVYFSRGKVYLKLAGKTKGQEKEDLLQKAEKDAMEAYVIDERNEYTDQLIHDIVWSRMGGMRSFMAPMVLVGILSGVMQQNPQQAVAAKAWQEEQSRAFAANRNAMYKKLFEAAKLRGLGESKRSDAIQHGAKPSLLMDLTQVIASVGQTF